MYYRFLRILLPLFLASVSFAAQPVYKLFDQSSGLPTNTLYDVFQDDRGFIWIGHELGISRFDGRHFINYINPEFPGTPLSNLMQDSDGKIWCQSFNGVYYFLEQDTLKRFKQHKPLGNYITGIIKGNYLYASATNGFGVYNLRQPNKTRIYNLPLTSLRQPTIFNNKVYTYDGAIGTIYSIDSNSISYTKVKALGIEYLLGADNKLLLLPKNMEEIPAYIFRNNILTPFLQYPIHKVQQVSWFSGDKTLGICTPNGIYFFNIEDKTLSQKSCL